MSEDAPVATPDAPPEAALDRDGDGNADKGFGIDLDGDGRSDGPADAVAYRLDSETFVGPDGEYDVYVARRPGAADPDDVAGSYRKFKLWSSKSELSIPIPRALWKAGGLASGMTLVLCLVVYAIWGPSAAPPPPATPAKTARVVQRMLTDPVLRDMVSDDLVPYLERAVESDLGHDVKPLD